MGEQEHYESLKIDQIKWILKTADRFSYDLFLFLISHFVFVQISINSIYIPLLN